VLLGGCHEILGHASGQIVAQGVSLHYHLAFGSHHNVCFIQVRRSHGGQASAHKQET
jgi:hypothetical protein